MLEQIPMQIIRRRLHVAVVIVATTSVLACVRPVMAQVPEEEERRVLEAKIAHLQVLVCGPEDSETKALRGPLDHYIEQLRTLLGRQIKALQASGAPGLSADDQAVLAGARKHKVDALATPCQAEAIRQVAHATTLADPTEMQKAEKLEEKRARPAQLLSSEHMELDFGPQDVGTSSDPKTATIKNESPEKDVKIIGVDTPSANYQIQENECPNKLVHGASCNIKVLFTPFKTDKLLSELRIRYMPISDQNKKRLLRDTDKNNGTGIGGAAYSHESADGDLPENDQVQVYPVTLRGTARHWRFPFSRAVAGTDISAASSKQTSQQYFIEFNGTAPVRIAGRFQSAKDPLDSPFWVFFNPRLTSLPDDAKAIGNLNLAPDSFAGLIPTDLRKISQGVDVAGGFEIALLKPRDGIPWWGEYPNSRSRLGVSWVIAAGATTPFAAINQDKTFLVNDSVRQAFPTVDFKGKTNVTFTTQDRSRFFRKWYAGFRFKTFWFNPDIELTGTEDECGSMANPNAKPRHLWNRWPKTKRHPCEAPYNIFPGVLDLTFGQDEAVTAGHLSRIVMRVDAVYPLPFQPAFHVFSTFESAFRKNQLTLPITTLSPQDPTDANTLRVTVPLLGRDFFRIGVGVDLVQLFKLNKPGQPSANAPAKDATKAVATDNTSGANSSSGDLGGKTKDEQTTKKEH